MNVKREALKRAFPYTIPVFIGFTFLGIAYGILMNSKGYGFGWVVLTSLLAFAGSAQYVAINYFTSAFNPMDVLILTLMINARHIFYGISMLEKYSATGKFKPYLIFGLCDETFSIVCSIDPPDGIDRKWFMFFITLLNHSYWVIGSAIGGLIGCMIAFNTTGLDFVLTALFVVIFIEQWLTQVEHKPALIGVISSFICLIVFGRSSFIIPSMITILASLTLIKINPIEEVLQ